MFEFQYKFEFELRDGGRQDAFPHPKFNTWHLSFRPIGGKPNPNAISLVRLNGEWHRKVRLELRGPQSRPFSLSRLHKSFNVGQTG